jgi:hypothetical protein
MSWHGCRERRSHHWIWMRFDLSQVAESALLKVVTAHFCLNFSFFFHSSVFVFSKQEKGVIRIP